MGFVDVFLWVFGLAGLALSALGALLGLVVLVVGVVGRPLGVPGSAAFGATVCLWWVSAAGASLGLLQADAAVVAGCLALWLCGAPIVFGGGFVRVRRRARTLR